MKKLIAICIAALITSMLVATAGAALLIVRDHTGPPQYYRDAAITEIHRPLPDIVNVNVVKGVHTVMMQRIASYVKASGGQVEKEWDSYLTVRTSQVARRHISTLHADGKQLSPNYRNWDHQTAIPGAATYTKYGIYLREKPFSKLQLDLGISLTAAGGIITFLSSILTMATIAKYSAATAAATDTTSATTAVTT